MATGILNIKNDDLHYAGIIYDIMQEWHEKNPTLRLVFPKVKTARHRYIIYKVTEYLGVRHLTTSNRLIGYGSVDGRFHSRTCEDCEFERYVQTKNVELYPPCQWKLRELDLPKSTTERPKFYYVLKK
jgi:hypothetical protein